MAYGNRRTRTPRTARKRVETVFFQPDGTPGVTNTYTQTRGSSPGIDVDEHRVIEMRVMTCGCYGERAAGVCYACVEEGHPNPNLCKTHRIVCPCGESLCLRHSRVSRANGNTRLCRRCYTKERNQSVVTTVGRVLRFIFFKDTHE